MKEGRYWQTPNENHQNLELGQTSLIKSHPVQLNWALFPTTFTFI